MQLGGFFIWTHAYSLMKKAGAIHEKNRTDGGSPKIDADVEAHLLNLENEESSADQKPLPISSTKTITEEDQNVS